MIYWVLIQILFAFKDVFKQNGKLEAMGKYGIEFHLKRFRPIERRSYVGKKVKLSGLKIKWVWRDAKKWPNRSRIIAFMLPRLDNKLFYRILLNTLSFLTIVSIAYLISFLSRIFIKFGLSKRVERPAWKQVKRCQLATNSICTIDRYLL